MLLNGTVITALTLDRRMGDEKENSRAWWRRRKKGTSQCDNPLCPHRKFPLRFPHSPDSDVSYERWKLVVAGPWVHVGRGTWKLRGTGGCRCYGSWEGDRVQKHGEGDSDNPQNP